MLKEFEPVNKEIVTLINAWETILWGLPEDIITQKRNCQNRTIKQILGHLVDSASNNTHRIIHLQYQDSPLVFPNYASNGNNDRWIAIQNYQQEDWNLLISLWKYSNLHLLHVIDNIIPSKLDNQWICSSEKLISLRNMVVDYLRHLKLHLGEIEDLMKKQH